MKKIKKEKKTPKAGFAIKFRSGDIKYVQPKK